MCWQNCSDDVKTALQGLKATNDEAESALGGATHEIQKAGRVHIPSDAAVSDVRRSGFFYRSMSDKDKDDGMFHESELQLLVSVKQAMQKLPCLIQLPKRLQREKR